jgi:hypothetical protein
MLNLTPEEVNKIIKKQLYLENEVLDNEGYVIWSQGLKNESQFFRKWLPELNQEEEE